MSTNKPYSRLAITITVGEERVEETVFIAADSAEVEKQINDWCVGRASLITYSNHNGEKGGEVQRVFGPVYGAKAIIGLMHKNK